MKPTDREKCVYFGGPKDGQAEWRDRFVGRGVVVPVAMPRGFRHVPYEWSDLFEFRNYRLWFARAVDADRPDDKVARDELVKFLRELPV